MTSGISIKNPEVVEKVQRLAAFLGTSYTQAISRAADQALAQQKPDEATRRARIADIEEAIDKVRNSGTGIRLFGEDDMYDEWGLPLW